MNRTITALSALSLVVLSTAAVAESPTLEAQADIALESDHVAWDFVEGITT
ncbi:MAG: peptidase M28 family protein, partial [Alphaproteobacteria bacterium HGW-Alphaproteobacteria-9]